MQNTLLLIEQLRRKVPKGSNYAVAKALEMTQGDLNRVLAGKNGLGIKAAVRLSEVLHRDLKDIVVLLEEDKAKRPKDIEFWGRRSPRITATGAIAALALVAAQGLTNARAAESQTTVYANSADVTDLYIMRSSCRPYTGMSYFSRIKMSYPRGYSKDGRDNQRTDLYEPQRADPP